MAGPLGLVDLHEMITKLFFANYVSVHDSIMLTKMRNHRVSTSLIDMTFPKLYN